MNTKLMEELENPPSFNKIMDEDLGMVNELTLLASNIKKGLCCFILFYFEKNMKKKHMHVVPNVNPRFKNLRLVSFPNRI